MTENQWPQSGSFGTTGVTKQTADPAAPVTDADYPAAPYGAAEGTPSKTDTAKNEAGEVTRQATDSAQQVAQTAKAEAANVAGEVKANAKDLLYQAKSDLTDQAGTQQQKVAQGLHSISGELRTMANASDQPGVASDLIRQAADRSASVASWLEGRDPGSLLNEVKSFARQRPGTFLLLAAGAGILAGRLTRSLSAGAPESTTASYAGGAGTYRPAAGTAVPPPPVDLPGPGVTSAGMTGTGMTGAGLTGAGVGAGGAYAGAGAGSDGFVEETYPPNPLTDDETQRDQWSDDPLAGDRIPESPLTGDRPEDDPYRDDPLRGGQR